MVYHVTLSRGCDVPKTCLTYLLYRTVYFDFGSWSISRRCFRLGFSNGRRSKSVVVCRFGDLSKVPGRMFDKFCEYLSEDHAVDLSITYCQLGRACVS